MNFAEIRSMDISNGDGIGISIFVQGCPIHCHNCFNRETWDFDGGIEFTNETMEWFVSLANHDHIKRISILGGEPLCYENINDTATLIYTIRKFYKNKKRIWVYTGYTFESLLNKHDDDYKKSVSMILKNIDVLVDGRYKDDLKDITLLYKGSKNQRVIDVPKTLKNNKVVLYKS